MSLVSVDLERTNMTRLWWLPGYAGIVSFGEMPSHIPAVMIAAIRRRVREIEAAGAAGGELFDGLKTGDVLTV